MVDKGKLVEAVGYMRTSERGYVTPRRSAYPASAIASMLGEAYPHIIKSYPHIN